MEQVNNSSIRQSFWFRGPMVFWEIGGSKDFEAVMKLSGNPNPLPNLEFLGDGFSPTHLKNMIVKLENFARFQGEDKQNIWNYHLGNTLFLLFRVCWPVPFKHSSHYWNKSLVKYGLGRNWLRFPWSNHRSEKMIQQKPMSSVGRYVLDLPPTQDSSDHQDYEPF